MLLFSAGGGPGRNCDVLLSMNGCMVPIHGVCANVNGPGVSTHSPATIGPVPNVPSGPSRPSFVRMAMMPCAAAWPTEIPSVFDWPSGIAASESLSQVSSCVTCAGVSQGAR